MRADPAERSGYLRWFYRDWRPTWLGRLWSRAFAWIAARGLTPAILVALEVEDRRTGRACSTILVAVQYGGDRYVVSMLGEHSEWVKNVRAAGGRASIRRGRASPVTLTEMTPEARAPILKAWGQVATSGRRHLPVPRHAPVTAFKAIAADYPVFRIDVAS
jgi:hypothetical protein